MKSESAVVSATDQKPLRIEKISAGYGKRTVIRNIDLEIQPGETVGLIGLNGAGKTTLIKSVLGLIRPEEGSIGIFGYPPGHRGGKMHFSYLPERFDPPWFLNGIEFLRFSLRLYKKRLPDERLIEAASAVDLAPEALKRKVQSYSKGMRQKLGLLGTLLTDCPLLILDEPMSGLDPVARSLVKDQLVKARGNGHTVFFSSHILSDMDEICDRVAVLHDNEIRFTGAPSALKEQTGQESLERAFLQCIGLSG